MYANIISGNVVSVIEILLLAGFLAIPVYDWFNGDKTKQQVLSGELSKVRCYQHTMLFLWVPTLLLFLHLATSELSLADIGVDPGAFVNMDTPQLLGVGLLLIVAGYFAMSLRSTENDPKTQQQVIEQMQSVAWLMPQTRQQRNWFVFGVSVSAGVCEELLIRGFLLHFLQAFVGLYGAVILSSVLFGLCHIYQGWTNVLRTGFVGLVLALVFVLTESLLIAIVLHFMIDAYSGSLSYIANRKTEAQNGVAVH